MRNLLGNLFERWTENEMRVTVVCVLLSAVSLALSLTGTFSGVLPADIAWVAIVLCDFPILLGATRGVILEADCRRLDTQIPFLFSPYFSFARLYFKMFKFYS